MKIRDGVVDTGRAAHVQQSPSVGLELELAVAEFAGGASHDASGVFQTLLERRQARGEEATAMMADDRLIGLYGTAGVFSVDNGFNNLEYAFAPVGADFGHRCDSYLNHLAWTVQREVNEVMDALAVHGSGLLNLSEHPSTAIDPAFYARMRAPKPIYQHWVRDRGWQHDQGIDAKAQNGPTTGVTAAAAPRALNLMLWVAPALIALFANSPFEAGKVTGRVENRLTIWPRMFATARLAGDRRLHLPPAEPFADLAAYVRWMHGPGTAMQVVAADTAGYKGYADMLRVEGDPPLLEFLAGPARMAQPLEGGERQPLQPQAAHFEQQQFAQFLNARIRFRLPWQPTLAELLEALHTPGELEVLFERCGADLYIEGRACGANFPDRELSELPDPLVAASVVMAPAALQKGLMANPQAWSRLSALAPWAAMPALRDAAIRDGLRASAAGLSLHTFAARVVEEAAAGLAGEEQWMLAYPLHVLRTGRNGADRALLQHAALEGDCATRIQRISADRMALPLPPPPGQIQAQQSRRLGLPT
ncbi:glutamate-cysteine ligase family protein [Stutzerimonas tarimensis]|uniref:Glutamate-cysteine ligase family protein n=1 Tax=Stutzerimonas tarimensis TaxID=1507735 RepID=A0ABV7T1L2_9GAMM